MRSAGPSSGTGPGPQREWATKGVAREARAPRDNDKAQRGFRIDRTEKLAAKARQTDRALDALEPVEKPWEGWELHFTIEEAERAGAVVARLSGAVVERGAFRLGPLDLQVDWGDRLGLTGRQRLGQVHPGGAPCSAPSPWRPASGGWARAWCPGCWARTDGRSGVTATWSGRSATAAD